MQQWVVVFLWSEFAVLDVSTNLCVQSLQTTATYCFIGLTAIWLVRNLFR